MGSIQILDCTPALADVISGNVGQPRKRRKRETAVAWFLQTPAWAKIQSLVSAAEPIEVDLFPPESLGLPSDAVFRLAETDYIIAVNEDGTRAAVINMADELARLWQRESNWGRPRIETDNPKTLAQRRWREKAKNR